MERVRQLVSAVIAGMMIGTGGVVFLVQENPVIGSFLFSIGLLTVLAFQLQLYTGKIGYLVFQKPVYLVELGITWIGNFMGTFLVAMLVRNTRLFAGIGERAMTIVSIKLGDGLLSIFILSIFCGMLMFIAVDIFRNIEGAMLKFAGIVLPVMVFILSGFEHVVANMFYFSLMDVWSGRTLLFILVMTLGNSLGGMLIPAYLKIFHLR